MDLRNDGRRNPPGLPGHGHSSRCPQFVDPQNSIFFPTTTSFYDSGYPTDNPIPAQLNLPIRQYHHLVVGDPVQPSLPIPEVSSHTHAEHQPHGAALPRPSTEHSTSQVVDPSIGVGDHTDSDFHFREGYEHQGPPRAKLPKVGRKRPCATCQRIKKKVSTHPKAGGLLTKCDQYRND